MTKIVRVRFRPKGRLAYSDAGDIPLQVNDYVMLETDHGLDIAKVVAVEVEAQPSELSEPMMAVMRRASAEDLEKYRQNLEKEALAKCKEMVAKLGLNMKPLLARYDLESNRLTIFFSAQERVDFRELVHKLRQSLEMRVELRQTGARDEARLLGGVGRCGYPLCCQSFLTDFPSLSIKMAKEQVLALNPMKISGVCGRLLCCLAHESSGYEEAKKRMPQPKQEISTQYGKATVVSVNLLKETVTVRFGDETTKELTLDQLT